MSWLAAGVTILLVASATACEREQRKFNDSPPPAVSSNVRVSALQPGPVIIGATKQNPYEGNAYAQAQGQRLFSQMNCNGCHANGGGGQGPALIDSVWIYGSAPEQIFATIVQGRPNGMPSYGGKLTDTQVWQLVAYVRAQAGIGRRDVRPGRSDHMQVRSSPQNTKAPMLRNSGENAD